MHLIYQFICFIFLIVQVSAKGRIAVQLVSYNNSRGLDLYGRCCDGAQDPSRCPTGKCDHVFDICVREPPGINRTTRCLYGSAEINTGEDQNVITFPDGKSLFDFDVWKGGVEIFINVTDTDSGDINVPVDNFTFDHFTSAAGYNSSSANYDEFILTGTRSLYPTRLALKVKVYCDPHYYGTDCSINCVADNSCSGHYNCDNKGNKVCLPGWTGVNCTLQIPGGVADCSVYGGGSEFVPSLWEGYYVCPDNNQTQVFQLNITRTEGKINVNGQLRINSVRLSVAGTYGSLSRSLTLQANSLNGSQIIGSHNVSNIELNTYQRNETFMDGKLRFNDASGVTCDITTLSRTTAYFSGCNFRGICIRYGTMKDDFYCCCDQGTVGPFCGPITTARPTTITNSPRPTSVNTVLTTSKELTARSTVTSSTIYTTTTTSTTTTKPTQQSTSSLATTHTKTSTTQPTTTTLTTPEKTTAMLTSITTSSTSKPTTTGAPSTTSTKPTTPQTSPTVTNKSTTSTAPTTSTSTTPTTTTSSATPSTTTKPSTSSKPATTITPSTNAPTTVPTTHTFTSTPSTSSATTAIPTVTTSSKTITQTTGTTQTTIQSSTPSTTPSTTKITTTEKIPTTLSSARTTLSTTPRTTTRTTQAATTTRIPPLFTENTTYNFMIQLVQEELDTTYIVNAIYNAWININKEHQGGAQLNTSLLNISDLNSYQAIGDEGILFTCISYKMSFRAVVHGNVYVPTADKIESELNTLYRGEVILYKGKSIYPVTQGYQIYIYGPPPTYVVTKSLEIVLINLLKTKCQQPCDKLTNSSISLKKTEEYVGDNGLEITKLYLFVEKNGLIVDTKLLPNLPNDEVDQYLTGNSVKVYKGIQKRRYRFHYKLLVKGYVYSEDIRQFESQVQQIWYQKYKDQIFPLCIRTEEFVSSTGELLTAIMYFFKLRQTITVPVHFPSPSTADFNSSINITNPNGKLYNVYTEKGYFRFRHRYSLLIKDRVDIIDIQKIVSNIEEAWNANNISLEGAVTLEYTTEKHYVTTNGGYITELVCFVLRGNRLIDARTLNINTTQISNWLINHSKVVSRQSGQEYVLYTDVTNNIIRTDLLFNFYFTGYLIEEDKDQIKNTTKTSWQRILGKSNVTVYFKREEAYMEQINRETVTKIAYAVYVNGKLLKATTTKQEITSNISVEFSTALASLAGLSRKYELYKGNTLLLNYQDLFQLHFTTKISNVQLENSFSQGLLSSLRTSWRDYKNYNTSLRVHVAFQDKIYINNKFIWRVGFFMTSKNKQIIKSFVSTIRESVLQNSFNLTSLTGVKYRFYTNNTAGLSYRLSYNLMFKQEVSMLDWVRIQETIRKVWCQEHNKVPDCVNKVTIVIKEQEKYIDATGKFYWKLIYFVTVEKKIYDSRRYLAIHLSNLDFTWENVYKTKYDVALISNTLKLWRYYYGFHLYTKTALTNIQIQELKTSLLKAWYNMSLVPSLCKCFDVTISRPRLLITGSGESIWQLTYFLKYKSSTVDSSIWPSLNMSLLKIHFISNIDFYYYEGRFKFYSSIKVSTQDYTKIEKSMLEYWLNRTNNTEYKTCGCISIKIQSQEEIIDNSGKSHWLLHYFIKKNNKPLSQSTIRPFSWLSFSSKHNITNVHGEHYSFTSNFSSYTRFNYMGGLFVKKWIPPSQYEHFQQFLLAYYKKRYQGKNVTIDVSSSTKQFFSPDGSSLWHLPFQLRVNGQITYPFQLNTSEFESLINITAPNGDNYKLEQPKNLIDSRYYFSFKVNHKISPSVYPKFKTAIIATWLKKFPEWKNKTLNISIGNQEEVVVNGKTAWKLYYSLTVNGKKFFWSDLKGLDLSMLQQETKFKGPNGVEYSIVEYNSSSNVVSRKKMFSIYLNAYTATSDIIKIREKLKHLWETNLNVAKFLTSIAEKANGIDISFAQQKKYIDSSGKIVWKWDYSLEINKTRQYREAVPILNMTALKTAIGNITSISGNKFVVMTQFSSYKQYNMHFPMYVSTKVSKANFKEFKRQLILAWNTSNTGLKTFDIDVTSQEELVKENGESVWKLVYFLKNNSKVVDSRVTEHLNISKLHTITGPRGQYSLLRGVQLINSLQHSYSRSIYLSNKLGTNGKKRLQGILTESIKNQNKDLHGKIQVDIRQQEEYVLKTGKRAWRIVYFIKIDDDYIPAYSLKEVDQSSLVTHLNFTGPQSQNYTIVNETSMYRYRHAFFLHFDTKIATKSFSVIRNKIKEAWKTSKTDYKTCNCLSVEAVDHGNLEEVFDKDGKYYWRLIYFMKSNGSIVESMTHIPLNISHMNEQLKTVTNAKNKQYRIIDVNTKVLFRTRLGFKLNLNLHIGYKDRVKFEQSIRETWIKMKPDIFHYNSTEISIKRSMRYVHLATRKPIWQITYFLKHSGQIIDPLILPKINTAYLKDKLSFKNPKEMEYKIITDSDLVDYRFHFALFLKKEVRETDFRHFESAVSRFWSRYHNTTTIIVNQEEHIDDSGRSFWKLVTFLKDGTFIDSQVTANINITQLQQFMNFTDTDNKIYTLESKVPSTLKRYDISFSFFVSTAIKTNKLANLSGKIGELWKDTGIWDTKDNIKVDIRKQDKYLTNAGLSYKVIYYLAVNDVTLDSNQFQNTNSTNLKDILQSLSSTTDVYNLIETTKTFRYEEQFSFLLTKPVLLADKHEMEIQLQKAWTAKKFKNVKIQILLQDEFITLNGKSLWRILYTMTADNITLKSTQEGELSVLNLEQHVNLTETGTNTKYTNYLDWTSVTSMRRYQELFGLYFSQRVEIKDYKRLTDKIKVLWSNVTDVTGVKILKQEKVIDKYSEAVWSLLYSLETSNTQQINNVLVSKPSFHDIKRTIQVINPLGKHYDLVNIQQHYRLSQMFHITVNRRIYKKDMTKFSSVLKSFLQNTTKGFIWTAESNFVLTKEDHVINTVTGSSRWQYGFVVNVSGKIVDASMQQQIDIKTLQDKITFMSPRKETYVLTQSGSVQMYSDRFQLNLKGRIKGSKDREIKDALKMVWQKKLKNGTVDIVSLQREEYIANSKKETITKYSYFLKDVSGFYYPTLTQSANMTLLVTNVSEELYIGSSELQRYKDCYKLYIVQQKKSFNKTALLAAILKAWTAHIKGTTKPSIRLIQEERYVGSFGIELSTTLYTVNLDTEPFSPNYYLEPNNRIMEAALRVTNVGVSIYKASATNIYRTSVLYDFSVRQESGNGITVGDKLALEGAVQKAWKSHPDFQSSTVTTEIVYNQQFVVSNSNNMTVNKLFYKVDVNATRIVSWQKSVPGIHTKIQNKLEQTSSIKDKYKLTSNNGLRVRIIFVKKTFDAVKIKDRLTSAWKNKYYNNDVKISILSSEKYSSTVWEMVYKVRYTVNISGINLTDKSIEPSFDEIETSLKSVGISQCGCKSSKLRKMYVFGTSASLKYTEIKESLQTVWRRSNNGSAEVKIRVHDLSKRNRRDTSTPSYKLVGNNGEDIAPLEYAASVLDQEPNSMFITQPNDKDLHKALTDAQAEPCRCKPKLAGNILLDGKTKDGEKDKIKDAIKDAFVKSNPGMTKDDFDVELTDVNNDVKDQDGKPVSDVAYRVQRKDGGDVEHLVPPTRAHLESSLANAGKTLHSRAAEPPAEEESWKIPVAVVCAIVGFIIICVIIGYVVYMTRRSRKEDLLEREDKVYNQNKFDAEHFSDPAMYENPAYMEGTKESKLSVL